MKNLRRIYQVFFVLLFVVLTWLTAQGRLKGYTVTLFLDASPLNGLGTILADGNLAHTMWIGFGLLALTAVIGRFFCGWICPLGSLLDAASWMMRPFRARDRIRDNAYHHAQAIKYGILLALLLAAAGGVMLVGWLDPMALLTRSAAALMSPGLRGAWPVLLVLAAVLLLNIIRPRFWCRYLCPLGALYGVVARLSPGAIVRRDPTCSACPTCNRACPAASSPDTGTRTAECFLCWNCIDDCPNQSLRYEIPSSRGFRRDGIGINRRGFVAATIGGLAIWTMFRADGLRGYPMRIRPPGSLPEDAFLDRCITCGACMKVCPTHVLRPSLSESGAAGLWTPVLDMANGYCELNCTLCSQVCPTGAIERITIARKRGREDGEPIKIGTAFVDRNRCLPWSFGRACLVCQEVCPVSPKAIETVMEPGSAIGKPVVDPSLCIGCGLCQHECPVPELAAIRITSDGESRHGGGFYLQTPDRRAATS